MATRYVTGGVRLQARLDEISRNLSKGATLRVGFLEGATEADGTPVALVAAVNEFGAPSKGIPPRPFIRRMIAEKSGEWPDAVAALLVSTDYNVSKTLEITGHAIKGQMQQSIRDLTEPPLKPSTIKKKGFDKPLIDTGNMIKSVDFEVV